MIIHIFPEKDATLYEVSASMNTGIDRYEYISGSTVDLKIFDKRTGKMYVRGRDFVTEYDVINGYYRVRPYSLYEE